MAEDALRRVRVRGQDLRQAPGASNPLLARTTLVTLVTLVTISLCVWLPTTAAVLHSPASLGSLPVIVVYSGTAGGLMAAMASARMNSSHSHHPHHTVLVSPTKHLGGMVTSGLGATDGKDSGGLAAEFFARAGGYAFAPSQASRALAEMLAATSNLTVLTDCGEASGGQIDWHTGPAPRLRSLQTPRCAEVNGTVFIDSSYEGDLLPLLNLSSRIGREARTEFNETAAGLLSAPPVWSCGCNWNFGNNVSGLAANGSLLPMITTSAATLPPPGSADSRVMAYNFRLCFTNNASARVAFPPAPSYDPARWELLRRGVAQRTASGHPVGLADFLTIRSVGNSKTDVNNGGGLSTDFVGGSWAYPSASASERQDIWDAHKNYTLELLHFIANDPVVPSSVQQALGEWGLCGDEFLDSQHWPPQLYVREARRLVGDFVFTQHDRVANTTKPDSVCVGAYNIDGHMTQRILLPNGTVTNEGCLSGWARATGVHLRPFEIPYRVLLPKRREGANLLVSAAVSATHVGSGSLRLEPQYMNIGQAAAVAAVISLGQNGSIPVQDVPISILQQQLQAQHVQIHA